MSKNNKMGKYLNFMFIADVLVMEMFVRRCVSGWMCLLNVSIGWTCLLFEASMGGHVC